MPFQPIETRVDFPAQERALPPLVFRRLHLNNWVEGSGAFLSVAEVDAVFADYPEAA